MAAKFDQAPRLIRYCFCALPFGRHMKPSMGSSSVFVFGRRQNHFRAEADDMSELEVDPNPSPAHAMAQVIDEHRIAKAAPDWLPLMPGCSYWLPPVQPKEELKKPKLDLSDDQLTAFISPFGWPAPIEASDGSDSEDDET